MTTQADRREQEHRRKTIGDLNGPWMTLFKVAIAAMLSYLPAGLTCYVATDRRITKIEASRFTTEDGRAMTALLQQKADRDDVPPPEVVIRLKRIEHDIERITGKLDLLVERSHTHTNGGPLP